MNAVLLARHLHVTHVYMDDTSCTITFRLPVVSVLCRDDSDTVHCVAWGLIPNRTTDSFVRFLTFMSRFYGDIKTVICDRHAAQRKAIVLVFGEGVKVLHCCVHVARNIQRNTGMKTDLLTLFWAMGNTNRGVGASLHPSTRAHSRCQTLPVHDTPHVIT